MQAANIPPSEALATLPIPFSVNFVLTISNVGSWIAENKMSRAKVGPRPI